MTVYDSMGRPGGNPAKLRAQYRDNGLRWTTLHACATGLGRAQQFFEQRARSIERAADRPGINSVDRNRAVWGGYDWSSNGEEWTTSEAWRNSLIDTYLTPYIQADSAVVEIGPGAGRWTELLHERSRRLYLADITSVTLELCRARLGDPSNVEYLLTDGATLSSIETDSVDLIWSFDVFVHVAPADQRSYLAEFARVLRPGGTAVVHHGGEGGVHGGWRSAMTAALFREYAEGCDLTVTSQDSSWGPRGEFVPSIAGDVISVLEARQ